MNPKQTVKKILREAPTWEGWRVVEINKGWMIYPADKRFAPIVIHRTPSDRRSAQNMISRLRRAGAPI